MHAGDDVIGSKEAKENRAESISWFKSGEADPNPTEILFFALLLVQTADKASDLHKWACDVAAQHDDAVRLQSQWRPPTGEDGWGMHGRESRLWLRMRHAYQAPQNAPRPPPRAPRVDEYDPCVTVSCPGGDGVMSTHVVLRLYLGQLVGWLTLRFKSRVVTSGGRSKYSLSDGWTRVW